MRTRIFFAAACIAALMGGPASAATIVGAVSATASSELAGFGIGNTIDQSGLSANYVSGVTDFDAYIAGAPSHNFSANLEWFTDQNSATLDYDLGQVLNIDRIAYWNEDGAGVGSIDILGSADGVNFTSLATGLIPTDLPIDNDYFADIFSFSTIAAQFIRLEVSGCPQVNEGFDGCGMGEIAFSSVAAVPVPASGVLLLSGMVAVFAARRRKTA